MQRTSWWVLVVGMAVGCTPQNEDNETDEPQIAFTEAAVLENQPRGATADVYWPSQLVAHTATRFEAPAPPYEIREIAVTLYDLTDGYAPLHCRPSAGATLGVLVSEDDDASSWDPESWTTRSEETVSGEDQTGNSETVEIVHVLDPPLVVEEPGYVWVMYSSNDPTSDDLSCLVGSSVEPVEGPTWMFRTDQSVDQDPATAPWVRLTVATQGS